MTGRSGDSAGPGRPEAHRDASRPAAPWEPAGVDRPPAPWERGAQLSSPWTGRPAASGPAPADGQPAGAGAGSGAAATAAKPERKGSLAVALLLAAAAVAAAVVGFRVASISGEASGRWQTAVRLEVKRSTSAQETVRYLYNTEVPLAFTIIRARLILAELEKIPVTTGPAYTAVAIEISVQTEVLKALEPSSDLTKQPYALDSGGVDLGKRLADLRAEIPDTLKIDPDATAAPGDALAAKAVKMSLALVLFGLVGLLGALAQTFVPWRRRLLQAGTAVLVSGLALAGVVEVLL
jgi:hypothetical protein